MDFSLVDKRDDSKHIGIALVKISELFATQDIFSYRAPTFDNLQRASLVNENINSSYMQPQWLEISMFVPDFSLRQWHEI